MDNNPQTPAVDLHNYPVNKELEELEGGGIAPITYIIGIAILMLAALPLSGSLPPSVAMLLRVVLFIIAMGVVGWVIWQAVHDTDVRRLSWILDTAAPHSVNAKMKHTDEQGYFLEFDKPVERPNSTKTMSTMRVFEPNDLQQRIFGAPGAGATTTPGASTPSADEVAKCIERVRRGEGGLIAVQVYFDPTSKEAALIRTPSAFLIPIPEDEYAATP